MLNYTYIYCYAGSLMAFLLQQYTALLFQTSVLPPHSEMTAKKSSLPLVELGMSFPRALTPFTTPPPSHRIYLEIRPNGPISQAFPQETGSPQGRTASQRTG